jgi:TPP-dependent pyruvate/acetoin dehydrogenase alpha subunit
VCYVTGREWPISGSLHGRQRRPPTHVVSICSKVRRPQPFADTNSNNTLLRAHRQLVRLREMDYILLNAQRQGRISFYMTCRGEEAIHMGAASALDLGDPIFAQYREQGLLMWRGFTLEQFTNQCFSNDMDLGKGRQMPIHYGSRALNYHTGTLACNTCSMNEDVTWCRLYSI